MPSNTPDIFLNCMCGGSGFSELKLHKFLQYHLKAGWESGQTRVAPYSVMFCFTYACKSCNKKTIVQIEAPEAVRSANIADHGKIKQPD
jgi:hypothetical protein